MSVSDAIVLATFLLQCVAMVGGGIWFVANMQAATSQLKSTIDHLSTSINQLHVAIREVEDRQQSQEIRVAMLENNKR